MPSPDATLFAELYLMHDEPDSIEAAVHDYLDAPECHYLDAEDLEVVAAELRHTLQREGAAVRLVTERVSPHSRVHPRGSK